MRPAKEQVDMEMWLKNGSEEALTGMRTQICIMLKGAGEMAAQTNENKRLDSPVAAVQCSSSNRWVLTAWTPQGKAWGNASCPCLHSDPIFPDCPPGETVRLSGRVWFYEGQAIDGEIERGKREFR